MTPLGRCAPPRVEVATAKETGDGAVTARFAAQNFGAARPRAALNANFPFDFGKHPFFAFPRFYFIEARKRFRMLRGDAIN